MSERPWIDRDILLDTNVIIRLARFSRTGQWLYETFLRGRADAPLVSVVSVAEARVLADERGWGQDKRERLRKTTDRCVVRDISLSDASLLEAYVALDLLGRGRGRGVKMKKNDLWIAAECRRMGAILVTSDRDFDHLIASGDLLVDVYDEVPRAPAP